METSNPNPLFGPHGGYRKTLSFGLTCLVYHATTRFCARVYSYKNDPLGKTSGQMIGAARSARQNIVEGSARAGTSKGTEIRLLDVARGSLEELEGDYETFLVEHDIPPWSMEDGRYKTVTGLVFDPFTATRDTAHAFGIHIIAMRKRFAPWLEHADVLVAANAIAIVAHRARSLLEKQMEAIGKDVIEEGGFSERMTRLRLERRDTTTQRYNDPTGKRLNDPTTQQETPPSCPTCGKSMRRRIAKSGSKAGKPFWACTGYPDCRTIKDIATT